MKQLLVTDEIYIIEGGVYTPCTIVTNNMELKTGVNQKLLQYTIELEIGIPYKMVI
jgi:hypothetical protein